MSFDMGPLNNLSNVQKSAKTCAGGGGNTGYFARGQEEDENIVEFAKDYPNDSFEKITLDDIQKNDDSDFFALIKKLFLKIIQFIKNIFKK